jgi:hypothetical protein
VFESRSASLQPKVQGPCQGSTKRTECEGGKNLIVAHWIPTWSLKVLCQKKLSSQFPSNGFLWIQSFVPMHSSCHGSNLNKRNVACFRAASKVRGESHTFLWGIPILNLTASKRFWCKFWWHQFILGQILETHYWGRNLFSGKGDGNDFEIHYLQHFGEATVFEFTVILWAMLLPAT